MLISMTNAVNLTDGLDGLAAGCVAITCFAYVVVACVVDRLEAGVFAGAVAGACLGFVWWNSHPAAVFMGDSGSLALGAALASLAVITKTELLLAVMSGVHRGGHVGHHSGHTLQAHRKARLPHGPATPPLRASGMAEPKVVVRFWVASAFFAALGLAGL